MTLPNIIIPGAPKAGTTSIVSILNQHPDIFVSIKKEPRFFIKDEILNLSDTDPLKPFLLKTSLLTLEKYRKAYAVESKMKIDASIQYLFYYETTIGRIKECLGDPYIIIILRNPVSRAISNYKYTIKSEKCKTLVDAVKDELSGGRDHLNSFYHYYKQGLYYEPVKKFRENFTNVIVLFYEDFAKDNSGFVNNILDKLNLPELKKLQFVPPLNTSQESNWLGKQLMGKYSPFKYFYMHVLPVIISENKLYNLKTSLRAVFAEKKGKGSAIITSEDKKYLIDLYREDVSKLMKLLDITECPWSDFAK